MLPNNRAMEMNKMHVYLFQILFVAGVAYASPNVDLENRHTWPAVVARYVIYFLLIRGSQEACMLAHRMLQFKEQIDVAKMAVKCKMYILTFIAAAATVYYHDVERLFGEEFLILFFAHLVVMYLDSVNVLPNISYGSGMACSFFEGYLVHIMPNEGTDLAGFEENVRSYENTHGVDLPVKKLFLIITKNLYCPPDLKEFNISEKEDVARLEACQSMTAVSKDVAGVKGREYHNSVYKISRPSGPDVYVAAECATPIHTLYRAMQNAALKHALEHIDVEAVVRDFSTTLETIVDGNPAYQGKLVIIHFDNTNKNLNLADVLLDKVRELEKDFENIILKRKQERH